MRRADAALVAGPVWVRDDACSPAPRAVRLAEGFDGVDVLVKPPADRPPAGLMLLLASASGGFVVEPSVLAFSPTDAAPALLHITAVDDDIYDPSPYYDKGVLSFVVVDPLTLAETPFDMDLEVVIDDNDAFGLFYLDYATVHALEGARLVHTFGCRAAPELADVVVTAHYALVDGDGFYTPATDLQFESTVFVFTAENFRTQQDIVIHVTDDGVYEPAEEHVIWFTVESDDLLYDAFPLPNVTIMVEDVDLLSANALAFEFGRAGQIERMFSFDAGRPETNTSAYLLGHPETRAAGWVFAPFGPLHPLHGGSDGGAELALPDENEPIASVAANERCGSADHGQGWLNMHDFSAQECGAFILEQPSESCSHEFFHYAEGGDKNCGCVVPGSNCSIAEQLHAHDQVWTYRISEHHTQVSDEASTAAWFDPAGEHGSWAGLVDAGCVAACMDLGHCCDTFPLMSHQLLSCQAGCQIAVASASLAECTSHCDAGNAAGCPYTHPTLGDINMCMECQEDCRAATGGGSDSQEECRAGCGAYADAAAAVMGGGGFLSEWHPHVGWATLQADEAQLARLERSDRVVMESDRLEYTVVLRAPPGLLDPACLEDCASHGVTIVATNPSEGDLRLETTRFAFDASNWDVAQTAVVHVVNDDVEEPREVWDIGHHAETEDVRYSGRVLPNVTAVIDDIDMFTTTSLVGFESGQLEYGVVLRRRPTHPVVVVVTNPSEVDLTFEGQDCARNASAFAPRLHAEDQVGECEVRLFFDAANWGVRQTVAFSINVDDIEEPTEYWDVRHHAETLDALHLGGDSPAPNRTALVWPNVTVTIVDVEDAPVPLQFIMVGARAGPAAGGTVVQLVAEFPTAGEAWLYSQFLDHFRPHATCLFSRDVGPPFNQSNIRLCEGAPWFDTYEECIMSVGVCSTSTAALTKRQCDAVVPEGIFTSTAVFAQSEVYGGTSASGPWARSESEPVARWFEKCIIGSAGDVHSLVRQDRKQVTSAEECQSAAALLGLTWAGDNSYPGVLAGCHLEGYADGAGLAVYFNEDLASPTMKPTQAPICIAEVRRRFWPAAAPPVLRAERPGHCADCCAPHSRRKFHTRGSERHGKSTFCGSERPQRRECARSRTKVPVPPTPRSMHVTGGGGKLLTARGPRRTTRCPRC
jgi:hypothetical protein